MKKSHTREQHSNRIDALPKIVQAPILVETPPPNVYSKSFQSFCELLPGNDLRNLAQNLLTVRYNPHNDIRFNALWGEDSESTIIWEFG